MGKRDARIDKYIAKSADFAKPILTHLRSAVHAACPEVEETMKWSRPSFAHKGIVCIMSAFKEHCSFGFWKWKLMTKLNKDGNPAEEWSGQFGRITTVDQLPKEKVLLACIKEAVRLNEEEVKMPPKPKSKAPKKLVIPPALAVALKKNKKASAAFEAFSHSHKKEYVEWIAEAKAEETRARRVATTIEWLIKGKSRHWKYQKC